MKLALQWLRENPTENPTTAARLYHIEKEGSVLYSVDARKEEAKWKAQEGEA
jgi:hypothetical protein